LEEIVAGTATVANGLQPDVAAQVNYITSQFASNSDARSQIEVVAANGGVDYMYAEGQLLVREEYLDRVLAILGQPAGRGVEPVVRGVALVRLQPGANGQIPTVLGALASIEAQLGTGVATPDHVITVAPDAGPCPATEPREAYEGTEPFPGVCGGNGGAGVLVYIADTGLLTDAAGTHPWLQGVTGDVDPLPQPAPGKPQVIPPYAGHGTFVAGVVRSMAPAAGVIVINAFKIAGSTLESDLVKRLNDALSQPVDIFHLSISCTTYKSQPLIGIEAWLGFLQGYKGAVCVVAAGNDGDSKRHWPAASAGAVSVGALAADWRSRARFSDYGSWVDVYAPGRDLVNAYATGAYTCYVPPYDGQVRNFYGMATWSGTSFSTPIVTGLIAARMSRTGENGRQAADALLAQARRQAIPGTGPVLLPSCEPSCREDCDPRPCGTTSCGCRR
jgi:hypothetical protein